MRFAVNRGCGHEKIDKRLVLNWGQTWQKFVRDKKKAARKPRSFVGKRVRRKLPKAKPRAVDWAISFSDSLSAWGKRHVTG